MAVNWFVPKSNSVKEAQVPKSKEISLVSDYLKNKDILHNYLKEG